jgi:uncharacterized protein
LDEMNDRTCIVTRSTAAPEDMIRFVPSPDGVVVPDLKRKLPGRGCWVRAERALVDRAAAKNLFSRALKREIAVPDDLGGLIDRQLAALALGALGLARKAGQCVTGAAKTEASVRSGNALAVVHAREAADDGIRKITQARRWVVHAGGPVVPAYIPFSESELGLALGATNVIHAALLADGAGRAALKRLDALDRYRAEIPDDRLTVVVLDDDFAAEDTE